MDFSLSQFEKIFKELYGKDKKMMQFQIARYENLISKYIRNFGESDIHLFSTPGRVEISGNHTDHNHGQVMAAAISLDSIAAVSKNNKNKIVVYSEGYERPFIVDLNHLEKQDADEGNTNGLIRGIASRFKQLGLIIGGFNAFVKSDVLPGSGLSSSASIEVLIGLILNALFNENEIAVEILAKIGQYAENVYFGKPCGLMDQMACAVGGIISIDFENPENPVVEKIDFDFNKYNYSLLVVDTGGSHVDLTDDYAAVPMEMKSVAEFFGKKTCREISMQLLFSDIKSVREQVGDRAVLRAFHFLKENDRVACLIEALKTENFNEFLNLVAASGNSSFKWLQNIYSVKNVKEQGMSLALALTENYIMEIGTGANRVHGGGFAGTILVFLPDKYINNYINLINNTLGENKVSVIQIRSYGALYLNELKF